MMDSSIASLSMRIFKASYNKSEKSPMRWSAIDSDIDSDLYDEKMSPELFNDFVDRINNNTPVPDVFKSVICEETWCGGMPYVSIAHYKAGEGARNVPGIPESVYVDGTRLKSKGILYDNPLGRQVFDSLREDLYMEKSGNIEHDPVRISIGFLDLQHKHTAPKGGQEFTFTRTGLGQICPLCEQGIGGKIYMKGQLVHLALTRVPVNPRTKMDLAEKSMGDIKSKKDDARSIVKDLADTLDEKSLAEGTLVVRAETEASQITSNGSQPVDDYHTDLCKECYDPNTDSYDQECVNKVLSANAVELRKTMDIVKSQLGEVLELARRNDVSDAEKKHAKKEYGDVTYADAENNKYPIDTEEHIRAAWNYIHQERNAAKYSDNGAAIKKKILAAWKRVIGGEPPSVEKSAVEELSMNGETVNKMQLGGENVEEKQFEYDALGVKINGDPQKNVVPNPIKGKVKDAMDKEETEETPDDEKREKEREGETKSVMDKAFAQMKALVAKGASVEEVNQAFASLGTAVEQEYQPKAQPVDMNNIAEIVKSAVASAVAPLQIEIAQLKAGNTVSKAITGQAPLPRSLTIRPQELLQKAVPANQEPMRKLSQIEKIARKTVGLDSGQ